MIAFNEIRLALSLSWNEFYLCYLVDEKKDMSGFCSLSRNDMSANMGISKQAVIDLIKKSEQSGYLINDKGKIKCSEKWSRNFTEAIEFSGLTGKVSLPNGIEEHSVVKKLDHLLIDTGKETLPVEVENEQEPVKKLYHFTNDSGQESLPNGIEEHSVVKKLYQQIEENSVQKQENDENGKDSLPVGSKSDLYIDNTKEDIINKDLNNKEEKESEEKQEKNKKPKPYELETDKDGISRCKVLRASCHLYNEQHPEKYKPDLYTKFIRYWSAPDLKGVPLWYRKQKAKNGTWNLPLRLATWESNNSNFTSNGTNNFKRGTSALRPTSIAQPSKSTRLGNVTDVEL